MPVVFTKGGLQSVASTTPSNPFKRTTPQGGGGGGGSSQGGNGGTSSIASYEAQRQAEVAQKTADIERQKQLLVSKAEQAFAQQSRSFSDISERTKAQQQFQQYVQRIQNEADAKKMSIMASTTPTNVVSEFKPTTTPSGLPYQKTYVAPFAGKADVIAGIKVKEGLQNVGAGVSNVAGGLAHVGSEIGRTAYTLATFKDPGKVKVDIRAAEIATDVKQKRVVEDAIDRAQKADQAYMEKKQAEYQGYVDSGKMTPEYANQQLNLAAQERNVQTNRELNTSLTEVNKILGYELQAKVKEIQAPSPISPAGLVIRGDIAVSPYTKRLNVAEQELAKKNPITKQGGTMDLIGKYSPMVNRFNIASKQATEFVRAKIAEKPVTTAAIIGGTIATGYLGGAAAGAAGAFRTTAIARDIYFGYSGVKEAIGVGKEFAAGNVLGGTKSLLLAGVGIAVGTKGFKAVGGKDLGIFNYFAEERTIPGSRYQDQVTSTAVGTIQGKNINIKGTTNVPKITELKQSRIRDILYKITGSKSEFGPRKVVVGKEQNINFRGKYNVVNDKLSIGFTKTQPAKGGASRLYSSGQVSTGDLSQPQLTNLQKRLAGEVLGASSNVPAGTEVTLTPEQASNIKFSQSSSQLLGKTNKAGNRLYLKITKSGSPTGKITQAVNAAITKKINPYVVVRGNKAVSFGEGTRSLVISKSAPETVTPNVRGKTAKSIVDIFTIPEKKVFTAEIINKPVKTQTPNAPIEPLTQAPKEAAQPSAPKPVEPLSPPKIESLATDVGAKINIEALNIRTPSTPAQSEYFGKGTYERSSGGLLPGETITRVDSTASNIVQVPTQKSFIETSQVSKVGIKEEQKPIVAPTFDVTQIGGTSQTQEQGTILGQASAQTQAQLQQLRLRLTTPTVTTGISEIVIPEITRPIKIPTPKKKSSSVMTPERIGRIKKAFNVVVKKKGQFVTIAKGLPEGKAKSALAKNLLETLSASGKITPSGTTSQEDIKFEFAPALFTRGKRDSNLIVQRREKRLGGRTEIKDILKAQKSVSGFGRTKRGKKLKWFG